MGETSNLKEMIRDTLMLLCRQGVECKEKFSIHAVIGITVDDNESFYLHFEEDVPSTTGSSPVPERTVPVRRASTRKRSSRGSSDRGGTPSKRIVLSDWINRHNNSNSSSNLRWSMVKVKTEQPDFYSDGSGNESTPKGGNRSGNRGRRGGMTPEERRARRALQSREARARRKAKKLAEMEGKAAPPQSETGENGEQDERQMTLDERKSADSVLEEVGQSLVSSENERLNPEPLNSPHHASPDTPGRGDIPADLSMDVESNDPGDEPESESEVQDTQE